MLSYMRDVVGGSPSLPLPAMYISQSPSSRAGSLPTFHTGLSREYGSYRLPDLVYNKHL
jgi:hypothetical protein